LHPSIFPNLELHQENEKGPGPLKWVSSNICFLLLHCFYHETFFLFFLSVGIKNDYLLLLLSVCPCFAYSAKVVLFFICRACIVYLVRLIVPYGSCYD
jgi:hypothetical protein